MGQTRLMKISLRTSFDRSEFEAGDDDDVQTAASLAFYEHLPTYASVRADLPNRITTAEFLKLKDLFRYFLEPDEYQAFEQEFLAAAERKRLDLNDDSRRYRTTAGACASYTTLPPTTVITGLMSLIWSAGIVR